MTEPSKQQYLTGQLLLAMPGMADPRFHKSVIFLCTHDANGAMGLVINNLLPALNFRDLLKQLNLNPADARPDIDRIPVHSGGPVETARGFLLHTGEFQIKDTIRVSADFGVTGTIDALKATLTGHGPRRMLFVLGYAGWTAGQLDREMQENGWLTVDSDPGLIFDIPAENKWDAAMHRLGINPVMLSTDAGRA